MANKPNKWIQPDAPPGPIFTGQKTLDLAKQVSDEIIEQVFNQSILYYSIDMEKSRFNQYNECIEKTFLPPIRVFTRMVWNGKLTEVTVFGLDAKSSILIHYHKRRLIQDQDIYVREGDFILYGNQHYEVVVINEPKLLYGNIDDKAEIEVKAIKARTSLFDAQ